MAAQTPMMQQYLRFKDQHPDAILFFRLGDFYEMFLEDARLVSRELELTLTARDGGEGQRVPMCGVPVHAVEGYLARLLERGYKVAICEQVEDPRQAKGLVRREVVRVATPGTYMDARLVGDRRQHYLAAVAVGPGGPRPDGSGGQGEAEWALAAVDISTGEFVATACGGEGAQQACWDELCRLGPAEVLLPAGAAWADSLAEDLRAALGLAVSRPGAEAYGPEPGAALSAHLGAPALAAAGAAGRPVVLAACGALFHYLQETQRGALGQITDLRLYGRAGHMVLDASARRHLELVARLGDGRREGSLLGVLDRTVTAMGGRLLRQWLDRPLATVPAIQERLDAVEALVADAFLRGGVREALQGVYDLERLAARVAAGTAGPRDLAALRTSLERLPGIRKLLEGLASAPPLLAGLARSLEDLGAVAGLVAAALVDEPPVVATEGGLIRPGHDGEVDRLREARRSGQSWIAALEAEEREKSGIRSLKIGFNKVFGYYIEISHANRHLVPADYIRKQTLANAERYVTPALKEKEEAVLGAEERLLALEYRLFCALREEVARHVAAIQQTARAVAAIDALASLADVASRQGYVKPEVHEGLEIEMRALRHPVLEQVMGPGCFVPNDACLDGDGQRFLLITGPNMAGKSTWARSVALAAIMAQAGSFVPADTCRLGLVDRVFTRIGAADDLFTGRSTFMVEMTEVAAILHQASARSLVVLDEVGRGTSTFDGLSLAWAVSEHLHDRVGARTIFATHYHELTALEELMPGVKNYTVAVKERGEDVIFLRRLVRGGADRSYGIQVARLAGLPPAVLRRAVEVLRELERSEEMREARREVAAGQLSLLPPPPHLEAVRQLLDLNVMGMTPLEALNMLHELQVLALGEKDAGQ